MNDKQFESWLWQYGNCWETGDSKRITALFSEGARYFETPFSEPMIGVAAIEDYWAQGAGQAQANVSFEFSSVNWTGTAGTAHWRASFIRIPSGVKVDLDGYLEAEFDDLGRCTIFREWWHRKESNSNTDGKS